MNSVETTLYISTAALLIVRTTMQFEQPILWVPLSLINLRALILTIRDNLRKGKSEVSLTVGVTTKGTFLSADYRRVYEYTIYLDDLGQFLGNEGGEEKLSINIKHN